MTVERIQEYITNRKALLTEWEDEAAFLELDALDQFIRKTDECSWPEARKRPGLDNQP